MRIPSEYSMGKSCLRNCLRLKATLEMLYWKETERRKQMKFNAASFVSFFAALLLLSILIGCAAPSSEDKKIESNITETISTSDNINNGGTQGTNEQNDLGCWPPSCSAIPDSQGKQACMDWKAGKAIQWPPDCTSLQSTCVKLCESEKKAGTQSNSPQTTGTQS